MNYSTSCYLYFLMGFLICRPTIQSDLLQTQLVWTKADSLLKSFTTAATQFADYETLKQLLDDIDISKNSTMDPEANMSVPDIIRYHGYPVEEHDVTTKDGYILTVHRIPYGLNGPGTIPRKPIIIQHGFLCSSAIWVISAPDKNLAYILANEGYDIWLTNTRGTVFGRKHISLDPSDKEFWKFSFDQMIEYDMPAQIDFVLEKTGFTQTHYIGHSLGGAVAFGLLSSKPEYNEKLREVITMGSSTTLMHTRSPIRLLAPFVDNYEFLLDLFGGYELLAEDKLMKFLCKWTVSRELCSSMVFLICGGNRDRLDMTRMPVYLQHTPGGTSLLNFIHLVQIMAGQKFQRFDFGGTGNFDRYAQPTPPEYDVTKITAPVALFWGDDDMLIDPKDVNMLASKLKNIILNYRVPDPKFNHIDFMWGILAKPLVYNKVVEVIKSNDW